MEKKMSLKMGGGFPKAFNPHLKKNKAMKKTQEEEKKINIEVEPLEPKEKSIPILISKEYLARQLIENGYIDSYIDFFYLGWKKTPNIKKIIRRKKMRKKKKTKKRKKMSKKTKIKKILIYQDMISI